MYLVNFSWCQTSMLNQVNVLEKCIIGVKCNVNVGSSVAQSERIWLVLCLWPCMAIVHHSSDPAKFYCVTAREVQKCKHVFVFLSFFVNAWAYSGVYAHNIGEQSGRDISSKRRYVSFARQHDMRFLHVFVFSVNLPTFMTLFNYWHGIIHPADSKSNKGGMWTRPECSAVQSLNLGHQHLGHKTTKPPRKRSKWQLVQFKVNIEIDSIFEFTQFTGIKYWYFPLQWSMLVVQNQYGRTLSVVSWNILLPLTWPTF